MPADTWATRLLRRIVCVVFGHRWKTLRTNMTKANCLAHLHGMAGDDVDCERCGSQWRDFYGFGITPENEHLCRRGALLEPKEPT